MRLLDDLTGPAPTWPAPLDAALEWWAAAPARARLVVRCVGAVVGVLAMTGGLVHGRWGAPVDVVVTRGVVPAGAVLTAADLAVAARPADLVPPGALDSPDDLPAGAVAAEHLRAGEVVDGTALRPLGPADGAPQGSAVVPVPADLLPALPIGTTLDVATASPAGDGTVVARGAVVVGDDGMWRWLRVARDDVPELAAGISRSGLVAAVLPPSPDAPP